VHAGLPVTALPLLRIFPRSWEFGVDLGIGNFDVQSSDFYPRDAMLARVIVIATCPSVCPSRAGIVSKRRKLAA